MPSTRHEILQEVRVQATTHAGLWLDKFLQDTGDEAKKNLVKNVSQDIETPDLYKRFFERWKQSLEKSGATCREARTLGRLAINLGAESVLETSIALHHTYGTPYLPGSALKGLAAHYALNHLKEWSKDSKAFQVLFGDTTSAGYVNFFDALYVPGSGHKGRPLWPDVITVHHPDYYQGKKDAPPADWDNPIPIPMLTTTGSFLIALTGPTDWVSAAYKILEFALEGEGIGAKTSSGYGRMKLIGLQAANELPAQKESTPSHTTLPAGYQRGVVKDFGLGPKQSYGFITPQGGGASLFVHETNVDPSAGTLKPGVRVIFKIGKGSKGPQAEDVRLDT